MGSVFLEIEYLKVGTSKQQKAFKILKEIKIFKILEEFNPLLAGTIPIKVDTLESDLDIICEVHDFEKFRELVTNQYGDQTGFNSKIRVIDGYKRIVCRFFYKEWEFEVFGQPIVPIKQNAYRHMVTEYRILNILGEEAREAIIELKKKGYKTEPAFGHLLQIKGNPYQTLLEMYEWNDGKLKEYLKANSIYIV